MRPPFSIEKRRTRKHRLRTHEPGTVGKSDRCNLKRKKAGTFDQIVCNGDGGLKNLD